MRFSRNVLRSAHICHAFLSQCLACGSIQMSCVRSAPVMRSCRNVLRSITPAVCRIAPNRTACDMFRSYSAVGRDRHSCVLNGRAVIGLGGFISGLRVSLWRSRRRTKETRERGDGERSRRRGVSVLLRDHIGLAMFSAGSTLGLRAPDCAKETRLPGLSSFDSRRECVLRGEKDSSMTRT